MPSNTAWRKMLHLTRIRWPTNEFKLQDTWKKIEPRTGEAKRQKNTAQSTKSRAPMCYIFTDFFLSPSLSCARLNMMISVHRDYNKNNLSFVRPKELCPKCVLHVQPVSVMMATSLHPPHNAYICCVNSGPNKFQTENNNDSTQNFRSNKEANWKW